MPDLDFTIATSPTLMAPFAFTSVRKLPPLTTWPDSDLVWLTSQASTAAVAGRVADEHAHADSYVTGVRAVVHIE